VRTPVSRRIVWGVAVVVFFETAAARSAKPDDGLRGPWVRHTIDDSSRGADGVRLADFNGDGRMDIVTGWEEGGVVRLCLNPGPGKARERWPAVTVGKAASPEDAVPVDLDGDGSIDVVSCCEGKTQSVFVHWAPKERSRQLDARAWQTQAIPATVKRTRWMFALPIEIDGRNGIDLIVGSKDPRAMIGWLESPGNPRDLAAWKLHPLCEAAWIMSLVAADLDGDGDQDILASDRKGSRSRVLWLENPGPALATGPWKEHVIGAEGEEVMFLDLADLDGDGRRDAIIAAKPRKIICLFQPAKATARWESHVIEVPDRFGTSKAVRVADVNLDGRLDLVVTCEAAKGPLSGVFWLSYRGSVMDAQWDAHDIGGPEGAKYDLMELIDLDGDGDLDVLTCEESDNLGVIWYENPTR